MRDQWWVFPQQWYDREVNFDKFSWATRRGIHPVSLHFGPCRGTEVEKDVFSVSGRARVARLRKLARVWAKTLLFSTVYVLIPRTPRALDGVCAPCIAPESVPSTRARVNTVFDAYLRVERLSGAQRRTHTTAPPPPQGLITGTGGRIDFCASATAAKTS